MKPKKRKCKENIITKLLNFFNTAIQNTSKDSLPKDWADLQFNLGLTYYNYGINEMNTEGKSYLNKADSTFKLILNVYAKNGNTEEWAMTCSFIGYNLSGLSLTIKNENEVKLFLDSAIVLYKIALDSCNKKNYPNDWATIQCNLGIALYYRGIRIFDNKRDKFVEASIYAYLDAIKIFISENELKAKAITELNLAESFGFLGVYFKGNKGILYLNKSLNANMNALSFFKFNEYPLYWARTQSNLGEIFKDQGRYFFGKDRMNSLNNSEMSFLNSFKVLTFEDNPLDWAKSKYNLGELYEIEERWSDALSCFKDAYKVHPELVSKKINEIKKHIK